MAVVLAVVHLLLSLFLWALLVRMVLDWVQSFAPHWRPSGPVLVLAEGAYTVTDPPLRTLRRLIPPLNLGGIQLDIAFLVIAIAVFLLLGLVNPLA
ncbi:YggT family protein [Kytococcus sp. Marseille-QA3725]